MKKILFIIIAFLLCFSGTSASEIFGKISTNPSDFPVNNSDQAQNNDNNPLPPADDDNNNNLPAAGAPMIFQNKSGQDEADNISKKEDVKVLGISHYPNKTLIRGRDHRIYIIEDQTKKYIPNLKELRKYTGQVIHDVDSKKLAEYQTRQHLNGDLIREKGTVRVYIIKNSQKKHILSLEELRADYFGQEIYNIRHEEMELYPDYYL